MSKRAMSLIVSKNLNILRLALNEEFPVQADFDQLSFIFLHLLLKLCVKLQHCRTGYSPVDPKLS